MQNEVEQARVSDHALWCGRTSPEPLAQTKARTSEQSCRKQSKSSAKKPPLFLSLKTGGPQQDALPIWGGEWSVAWRVFDAQFWGVPQRRRRIALIADFGGLTAPEILFERESVRGYFEEGRTPWENFARDIKNGVGAAAQQNAVGESAYCLQGNGIDRSEKAGCNGKGWTEDVSYTLNTMDRHAVASPAIVGGGLHRSNTAQ